MKVTVDRSVCQSHGQCVLAAPEVFDLDDSGELHYTPEPDDTYQAAVRAAADACPVQAISISD